MSKYSMDMSGEKTPTIKKLLPEGYRVFKIISGEPSVSKSGNDMIIFEFQDKETQYIDKVYAITTQGKRWFLKGILAACGLEASKDGVYDWDIKDVIGKEVSGLVEHEDNKWINREGIEVTSKQHKIVSVEKPEEIGWDDDK